MPVEDRHRLHRPFSVRRRFLVAGALCTVVLVGGACSTGSDQHPPGSSTTGGPKPAASQGVGGQANVNAPGATTADGSVVAPGSASGAGSPGCRSGDPLANVYHPTRLKVVRSCVTVSGAVESVRSESDGDVHFDLALDVAYSHLLTSANDADQHGWLVVEIVPADEPGCTPGRPPKPAYGTYDFGICTGADESPPPVGSHVYVTGPYVLDEDHGGWAEVHPAWAIASSPPGPTTSVPPPTTSPPATSSPATPSPAPTSGAWCTATAAPSNDGYAGDYEVYVDSNQPDTKATASDANDTWSEVTDSTGHADIRLYNTSPGEPVAVTVGAASCSTTA